MATDEKSVVKIGADGDLIECAKGLDVSECGYVKGQLACGKCGAVAVSVKVDVVEEDEALEIAEDDEIMKNTPDNATQTPTRKRGSRIALEEKAAVRAYGDTLTEEDEALLAEEEKKKQKLRDLATEAEGVAETEGVAEIADVALPDPATDTADITGDVADEAYETSRIPAEEEPQMDEILAMRSAPRRKKPAAPVAPEAEDDALVDETDDEVPGRQIMEQRRLRSMGYKSGEFGADAFVCSLERKVYSSGAGVCEGCPGGCVKEGSMPALLEIEGRAEDMFSGKVLDSGYSDIADIFVVDVERKDGKPIEAFFDGSTGEVLGWHMLNQEVLEVKSGFQPTELISFSEAASIATKSIQGDVMAVEADIFEGFDAYAVEIEGIDGKSYDVFVSLDGDVLGYDEYTQEEASSIEAEAAEIALKRAYSDEQRAGHASKGNALPDGSFPIVDETDLRNAITAHGRAKNADVAKLHIMERAMSLKLENLIPENWIDEETKKKFASSGKSGEDNFLSTLLEFEMLAQEADNSSSIYNESE